MNDFTEIKFQFLLKFNLAALTIIESIRHLADCEDLMSIYTYETSDSIL
jgi:hypothetical protein